MLNESSTLASGKEAPNSLSAPPDARSNNPAFEQLEHAVADVLNIHSVNYQPPPPAAISFTGRLRFDSETAYARLDDQFVALDYHVVLTTNETDEHMVLAIKGRIHPAPRPRWPNALLLVLTLLSLLWVGATHEAGADGSVVLWKGLPYAISILLILGTHELGHYFAARFHRVNVTLPYFIPFPFGFFGTLGAFIQLREPMRNRKVLFDVGVAGPLAGLIVAIPILIIGLATSDVEPLPDEAYILEGDSVLYAAAKFAIFGELLPNDNEDVFVNQLAMAGWTGLFITGLNLIPLGQLDGGHVIFTLLGRRARRMYLPVLSGFIILSFYNEAWIIWTLLLILLGRAYAVPLDTITELDSRRRWFGYAAMIIFVLVFVPNPLSMVQPQ